VFGYVAPVITALPEERKEAYRAVYCGVCHALLRRWGQPARIALSNDMTFLAMLLSSLYEPAATDHTSRCPLHPMKSHRYLESPMVDYAAEMNALLFYYKCVDQVRDERSAKGKAGEKTFRKPLREIEQRYPLQAEAVRTALDSLWALEETSPIQPDALCNLSGQMLGAVFVPNPGDIWAPVLRKLGEGLGRFIYWMDAWEDYDEDLKKHRFNPLTVYHDREDYEAFCRETLEFFIAEATEAFELLPLEENLDIMRNVLYSGVWQRYTLKTERRNRGKEEPHEQ